MNLTETFELRKDNNQIQLSYNPNNSKTSTINNKISDLINSYCEYLYQENMIELQTVKEIHSIIAKFAQIIKLQDPNKITRRTLESYLDWLKICHNKIEYDGISREIENFLSWLYYEKVTDLDLSLQITTYKKDLPKTFNNPFSDSDINLLFKSQYYTTPTKKFSFDHPYQYWIPLLLVYTGACINEISQLRISDIIEISDRTTIFINDLGNDSKLRSKSATRIIPINQQLIDLGFKDYVNDIKASGNVMLFDRIKLGKDGWGTQPSKWFGKHKNELGIDSKKNIPALRSYCYNYLKQQGFHDKHIATPLGFGETIIPPNQIPNLFKVYWNSCKVLDKIEYDFINDIVRYRDYSFRNGRKAH